MNDGKICVSVCAETAEKLLNDIKRAEKVADVIELRFDCLKKSETKNALTKILACKCEKPFLITFRPKSEGGRRDLTLPERVKFWESVLRENKRKDLLVDVEFDLRSVLNLKSTEAIFSLHDFSGSPADLPATFEIYRALTDADVIKFAVRADDVSDSIAVWKLLDAANAANKPFVPIAMGESGKWTRILGLAHGAPLTYAALDEQRETAPGQITARDLTETYRVKNLNEQTAIYGVLANPVAHSLSPFMHNAAFRFHNLDAVYIPFAVKNLDEFIKNFVREKTRSVRLNFKGFSVTIPHKQAIIKHLDFLDKTARKIGAVNTVKIQDGKLFGYNTDAAGFIEPLRNIYGDLQNARVAIFGAGGAARACIYALENEKASVTVFARDLKRAKILTEDFAVDLKEFQQTDFNDFDILINATPLGTKSELERQTPAVAAQLENVKMGYDLVYNPFETAFIKEARKANVPTLGGLAMLAAQAAKQFEIWTEKAAPVKEMSQAALKRIKN